MICRITHGERITAEPRSTLFVGKSGGWNTRFARYSVERRNSSAGSGFAGAAFGSGWIGSSLALSTAGVSTREGAKALNGVEIFARRDQLPSPSENEFYLDDLVGLEAFGTDGAQLGRVVALMNFGAGDILEIAPADGGETLLLPFTRRVAPAIDFDAGRIVIDRPHEVEDEDRRP